ncbi:mannose-6-phosphate isomeras-like protein [Lineolata rhizophorae]|uniref:Mannose-6-phosphate isomerase n=1 Tax=Lineolata rhizophorae TaxID=578093 RepID=A0A6A6NMQ0_9PEZI|nr:mannose-6-phosphate isomeras-like protein [Lineolata rhizophorae]
MQVPLIRLQCGVNSYDWGKIGKKSAAAKFAAATPSADLSIQDEKPYAELWMGTHPSLPSRDVETQRTLLDLVEDNAMLLSHEVRDRYGAKLPFLFKVLSISKALSIQAHPNKKLAEQLHARDPKNYPDDNHKPEMTIAITPFSGLCGFRPLDEIAHFLAAVAPLRKLVGEGAATAFETLVSGKHTSENAIDVDANKKVLKNAFSSLMSSRPHDIEAAAAELVESAKSSPESFAGGGGPAYESKGSGGRELAELVDTLNGQFPGDIGLFVLFFLNYVKLEPGEAMFLKADDIHAYISGDIIECMASSDNVVRAGFTPKFKDVSTLTSMLTYNYAPPDAQKLPPTPYAHATMNTTAYTNGSSLELYDPPIEEFAVVYSILRGVGGRAVFEPVAGPSIIICTKGEGWISVGPKKEVVKEGYVYFVGATAECTLESASDEFVSFKAFCELAPESKT